jgi:hypothetical protein
MKILTPLREGLTAPGLDVSLGVGHMSLEVELLQEVRRCILREETPGFLWCPTGREGGGGAVDEQVQLGRRSGVGISVVCSWKLHVQSRASSRCSRMPCLPYCVRARPSLSLRTQ